MFPNFLSCSSNSFCPKSLFICLICIHIMSFTARNCFDIVCNAICVYEFAEPKPAACSNDEIIVCIWSWYCLYLCSTCGIYQIHFPNQFTTLWNLYKVSKYLTCNNQIYGLNLSPDLKVTESLLPLYISPWLVCIYKDLIIIICVSHII